MGYLMRIELINNGLLAFLANNAMLCNSYLARRCALLNTYRRKKFNWLLEFKSWTKLFAFHFMQMTLGKASINLPSPSTYGYIIG